MAPIRLPFVAILLALKGSQGQRDWRYIAGNFVRQDGYLFMVFCHEAYNGYRIDAHPSEPAGQGTHHFCADQSGLIDCAREGQGDQPNPPAPHALSGRHPVRSR